ncbi:outer membrane immunogenic protein [Devosia crocina]|uniref:Outer membrane immunogenic protein n=1 Tax=Devosia crocina TaxID=429728 RepID=A0A1I7NCV0_9HYPH|nr:outer membrane beta-barrel protein [Devosia crocina]SFV32515.1 outer membrane immunogenic protein [Devosia crocina]
MFVRSLSLGVAAAALMVGGAQAADLIIPTTPQPIYESAGFDWEGLYAGVRIGGQWVGEQSYGNIGFGDDITQGVIGGAVGVNFIPVDPFLLGLEVTGDYVWGNDLATGEFFANLRAGAVVTDSVLVYALGGVGVQTGPEGTSGTEGLYQLGGGVEFAVTDAITVRGEIVGQGDFADNGNDFFNTAKATVGVFYHF